MDAATPFAECEICRPDDDEAKTTMLYDVFAWRTYPPILGKLALAICKVVKPALVDRGAERPESEARIVYGTVGR